MKLRSLAISWFREEDFPRWLSIDPEFQPDYAHWLARSEAAFARYQAAGAPIVKVTILPDEFLEWSKASGRGIGTDARAGFAAFKAMLLDHSESKH